LVWLYHDPYIRLKNAVVKYFGCFFKKFQLGKMHHAAIPLQQCEFSPGAHWQIKCVFDNSQEYYLAVLRTEKTLQAKKY